jgi:DNA-binding MarR family transcriptional regulator
MTLRAMTLRAMTQDGPMSSPPSPPGPDASSEELAAAFIAVSRLAGRSSSRARTGALSNARYELLHTLLHHGTEPMGRVAARLGVSPRSVTDMVDALEGEGYLRRTPHPGDRRAQLLELTPDGRAVVWIGRRARLAEVGHLFDALDERERAELGRLLAKVAQAARGGTTAQ